MQVNLLKKLIEKTLSKLADLQQQISKDEDYEESALDTLDFIAQAPLDIVTEYLRYHKDLIEITVQSNEKLMLLNSCFKTIEKTDY